MSHKRGQTRVLLEKSNASGAVPRQALLEQNLPWIKAHIRKRLGPGLRRKAETVDFVQDAARKFLG